MLLMAIIVIASKLLVKIEEPYQFFLECLNKKNVRIPINYIHNPIKRYCHSNTLIDYTNDGTAIVYVKQNKIIRFMITETNIGNARPQIITKRATIPPKMPQSHLIFYKKLTEHTSDKKLYPVTPRHGVDNIQFRGCLYHI